MALFYIGRHLFWLLEKNKKFLLHPNVHDSFSQHICMYMCVFHALVHLAQRPPQFVGLLCILSLLYILGNILTLKPFIYGIKSITITCFHSLTSIHTHKLVWFWRFFACLLYYKQQSCSFWSRNISASNLNIKALLYWKQKTNMVWVREN